MSGWRRPGGWHEMGISVVSHRELAPPAKLTSSLPSSRRVGRCPTPLPASASGRAPRSGTSRTFALEPG
jgi:hypothetical protein